MRPAIQNIYCLIVIFQEWPIQCRHRRKALGLNLQALSIASILDNTNVLEVQRPKNNEQFYQFFRDGGFELGTRNFVTQGLGKGRLGGLTKAIPRKDHDRVMGLVFAHLGPSDDDMKVMET